MLNFINQAQKRFSAYIRYRKTVAEIRAMSNAQLHEMGAFEIDMLEAARRAYLAE